MSGAALAAEGQPPPSERVSFNEHIRPIFNKHCVACHGGVKQASGLSLIYREQALAEGESGMLPIVPGKPEESYLLERVADRDPEMRMPPADHGPALSDDQIAILRRWIEQGAEWELHWSFVAPREPAVPKVEQANWPRDPLDHFIMARLEASGLRPAAEADKATWLRRASLDLTGIPPSLEEYRDFELDNRPDAYEQVVDRLLASPRYGERWTAMWLDLARYADTKGYEADTHRDIWPYRDWLIRALNADMPFDEFTIKQLAGDLLPDATLDDRLATAFNRNTQTNTEGGSDDEEFRTLAVLDRVSTIWQVWQASTFRCTQCHSHPYDPFRHEEYYKFVAILNTTEDQDLPEDVPLLRVPDDVANVAEALEIDDRVAGIRRELFELEQATGKQSSAWRTLRPSAASCTGDARLVVQEDPTDHVAEVVTEGTISSGIAFTLDFPMADVGTLAALRIDALPTDVAQALKIPEAGFAVTRLKGRLIAPDGAELAEVKFAAAFCDEPAPPLDPEDSLRDNDAGWGDYPRTSRPRYAIFVAEQPVVGPAGSVLRLELAFARSDSGGGGLCIRRGRYAVSDDPAWTALVASPPYQQLNKELATLAQRRAAIGATAVPVMAEQTPSIARRTFTFARGNWLDRETSVEPGVPAVLPPLAAGAQADRLSMARWLVAPDNPLTARVMVNRLWQELFGIGIVETAEDFGASGERPSHPELLDHLALRFQNQHAWSVKRMLRDLVLSSTYRQAGAATSDKLAADPRNRLLARGPRSRLSAEMLRDQALALSGRLSPKMYGKPVMPPQPDGVWRSVYNGAKWVTAEGEDRYRRAVYTFWKRTSGYPSMLSFDVPSRDVCVVRRVATNTPLQALVSLNDPALIELAQGFAERMHAVGGTPAAKIAAGYRMAVGKAIHPAKAARLVQLHGEALGAFDAKPQAAGALAADRELYALTIVANAMLNLDEVLTK